MYRSHEAKILVSHGLEAGHWVLKTRWILGLIEQQQYLLTYEGVEDRHGYSLKIMVARFGFWSLPMPNQRALRWVDSDQRPTERHRRNALETG